jgi:hypothetical protein
MNIRRGLFRLWLVLSVIWIGAIAAIVGSDAIDVYIPEKNYLWVDKAGQAALLPPTASLYDLDKDHVKVLYPYNVILHVDNSVPPEALRPYNDEIMNKYVNPRKAEVRRRQWEAVWLALKLALIPPIIAFGIGALLFWAFSGFKHPQQPSPH